MACDVPQAYFPGNGAYGSVPRRQNDARALRLMPENVIICNQMSAAKDFLS